MEKLKNIDKYLKNAEIKPSYQRLRIFEYLYQNKNHPTVDMIYSELSNEIPTLSKTTIYNTLKLFVKKNITQIINIEDNETRYDADISTHGHFKCCKCFKIYDFSFDNSNIQFKEIETFQINQTHLYIKGICKKCLN